LGALQALNRVLRFCSYLIRRRLELQPEPLITQLGEVFIILVLIGAILSSFPVL
jgi:hypothetical protein